MTISLNKKQLKVLLAITEIALQQGLFDNSDDMGNIIYDFGENPVRFDENQVDMIREELQNKIDPNHIW